MSTKIKLAVAGLVIAAAAFGVSYAAAAGILPAVLTAGTTRYAVMSATSQITKASSVTPTFADLPGLSQPITIPAGKTADLVIMFCGNSYVDSPVGATMQVRAMVGANAATPVSVTVRADGGAGNAENQCANFYRVGVSGAVTVKMQWQSSGSSGTAGMLARDMIIIENIH